MPGPITKYFRQLAPEEDHSPQTLNEQQEDGASLDSAAPLSQASSVTHVENDIGSFIKPSMSVREITDAINNLSNGEKYKLLTDHYKPSSDYVFPRTYSSGCNRSFLYRWLQKYPWLVYSKTLN